MLALTRMVEMGLVQSEQIKNMLKDKTQCIRRLLAMKG